MTERPLLVMVGGFLGAGKTSLILAAAERLQRRGLRVAAILNDQGEDLVDTQLAFERGVPADQVTGGCFCCRFGDLIDAAERLQSHQPDVIFAEAVGSCTDIVATTLRPLLRDYSDRFRVAPFTVLIDPFMAETIPGNEDLMFLWKNQVDEADLVWCTKDDLAFGHSGDLPRLSARTGQGIDEWLAQVMGEGGTVGTHALTVDYDRYARAEAALAWLNARAVVRPEVPCSPAMIVGPLMEALDIPGIVHLKVMAQCESGYVKAAVCRSGQEPEVEGMLDASPAAEHEVLVNLRALADPEALVFQVRTSFAVLHAEIEWRLLQSFRPAPPVPWIAKSRPA